eukprot:SAG25_NODE_130_length_14421_cov_71.473886_18_plen_72_part_00
MVCCPRPGGGGKTWWGYCGCCGWAAGAAAAWAALAAAGCLLLAACLGAGCWATTQIRQMSLVELSLYILTS